MKKVLFIFLIAIQTLPTFSQETQLVDSLERDLQKLRVVRETDESEPSLKDTSIIFTLNKLSEAYWASDPEKSIDYAQEGLALSDKIGYKIGSASAYHSLGSISTNIGQYDQAITYFQKSLEMRKAIGNQENIAGSELNLGQVYWKKGDYAEAMRLFLSALQRYEEITAPDQTANIAGCFLNIGILHAMQGESDQGAQNFKKALGLFQKSGDKQGEAYAYGNLGAVSMDLAQPDSAIVYDSLALQLQLDMNDQMGIANGYNNLAYDFQQLGNNQKALKNYLKSLKINETIDNQSGQTMNLTNIGSVYSLLKEYQKAGEYFQRALVLAKATGSYPDISDTYRNLASLDSANGNYKQALIDYKSYIAARDTIFNQDQTRKLTQVSMQYTFDKKEAAVRRAQEKKDAIAARKAQRERWIRNGLLLGFAVVLIFAIVFFSQRNIIKREKKISDDLLLNILPAEIAAELKETGKTEAKNFDAVTVLFMDFKNFTQLSEKLTAHELVAEINYCYSAFDRISGKYGIEKIKTIGDSYMCAGGLPVVNKTNAIDTVRVALEFRDFMLAEKAKREAEGKTYFEIRIGCNTGPVVAGIVGIKKYSYDIWGDTVNTASRMESSGEPGKVNISGSTYENVKDEFECTYRGKVMAKGKGEVDMYFVERKKGGV